MEGRTCDFQRNIYGNYDNLNAAISACKADEDCGYIYDYNCDGATIADGLKLCTKNSEIGESPKNCIYEPHSGKYHYLSSVYDIIAEIANKLKLNFIFNLLESCTCKDLISKWGYGNCQGTLDSSRGNVAVCYVNQPSSCGDLVDSSTNTGEKSSAEPCSQGNKLIHLNKTHSVCVIHE